jgi:hypothetical protein
VENVRIFDMYPHLVDLFISIVGYWLTEPSIKQEVFVLQSLIEILEAMVYSFEFWSKNKNSENYLNSKFERPQTDPCSSSESQTQTRR